MKVKYCFLLLLFVTLAFSQQEASVWYFGQNAGIKFESNGTITTLTDGQLNTAEGCATLADSNGNLLLYTDGVTVWNRNHGIMPNGTGLMGDPPSTQSATIVPMPGSVTLFYVFTLDAFAGGNAAASSFVASFSPAINIPIGDWSVSATPSIAFGNTSGTGISLGVGYSDGNFSASVGYGIMEYSNYNGFGANAHELRYSALINYDDGKTGFSLGTNIWRGDFKQQTGTLGIHSGDFRALYENDGKPFSGLSGDGNDQYRTAALNLSVKDVSLGFNLFTGERTRKDYEIEKEMPGGELGYSSIGKYGEHYKNGFVNERGTPYRLGALTVGYKGYRAGINSEWVRHAIQNVAIHGTWIANQRMFEMKSNTVNGYSQYKTPNQFTTW
ncbi:polymorphic toxin type 23 domain-containing protein [Flavobacterium sp.]|uniref:polymorphic toxin type 23 domain-containing protein n=1 Tax=Flavobacterium sp. TaxID=239 RepID=UPI0040477FF2